jgi:type II secretory pathway component PulF
MNEAERPVRPVLSVVLLAIVITALFTMIFYNYISRTVFTSIKENELLPKAKALGSIVQSFGTAGWTRARSSSCWRWKRWIRRSWAPTCW